MNRNCTFLLRYITHYQMFLALNIRKRFLNIFSKYFFFLKKTLFLHFKFCTKYFIDIWIFLSKLCTTMKKRTNYTVVGTVISQFSFVLKCFHINRLSDDIGCIWLSYAYIVLWTIVFVEPYMVLGVI